MYSLAVACLPRYRLLLTDEDDGLVGCGCCCDKDGLARKLLFTEEVGLVGSTVDRGLSCPDTDDRGLKVLFTWRCLSNRFLKVDNSAPKRSWVERMAADVFKA